jgi:hypothetical protein
VLRFQIGLQLLEYVVAEVEINFSWVTIRENMNMSAKRGLGYYELRTHKL